MEEEMCGAHSDDDKVVPDKNKKRIVKTRAQIEVLEKYFDEHKYPSETMKIQLAESIGLTEKQVSGWFCHRRLKDKKSQTVETCLVERQDRSSGVIQDRGSGLKQDSCGSTKQVDDRNLDSREVESGRFINQELSPANLTCQNDRHYKGNENSTDDETSRSTSSSGNVPSNHNGDTFDVSTGAFLMPTLPVEMKGMKARSGPAGYLKVKGQIENSAITSVKRQLGRHYNEDGPPLSVDFDPPPPGSFESLVQNGVETCYSEEDDFPISPDVSKVQKHPKFHKEFEYKSAISSYDSDSDRPKMGYRTDTPVNHVHQKFSQKMSLPDNIAYYPGRSSSVRFPESLEKDVYGSKSKGKYMRHFEEDSGRLKIDTYSSHHQSQPYGMKVEDLPYLNRHQFQPLGGKSDEERGKSWVHRPNRFGQMISKREDTEKGHCSMAIQGNGYPNMEDNEWHIHQRNKDDKYSEEWRAKNPKFEPDQAKMLKNEMLASKRTMNESIGIQHQLYHQRLSMVDDQHWAASQVKRSKTETPSSSEEDSESAETNSSMD